MHKELPTLAYAAACRAHLGKGQMLADLIYMRIVNHMQRYGMRPEGIVMHPTDYDAVCESFVTLVCNAQRERLMPTLHGLNVYRSEDATAGNPRVF